MVIVWVFVSVCVPICVGVLAGVRRRTDDVRLFVGTGV